MPRQKFQKTMDLTDFPKILLAEDDKEMRNLLSKYLSKAGYTIVECHDGEDLLNHLGSFLLPKECEEIDLVISDINMPGVNGLEILKGIYQYNFPPMVLITAFGDEQTHAEAIKFGAKAVFDKPFDVDEFVNKIGEIILD